MWFFKKKKKVPKIQETTETKEERTENELTVEKLFWKDYNVNIRGANEILLEVYRESKMEEDWEVPGTFIGIRLFEDGILKEDIPLHSFGNYGLFSLYAVNRHKKTMEFAVSIADFISKKIAEDAPFYDFKIKKRFVSEGHLYLLELPNEWETVMPEANPDLLTRLNLDIREAELHKKKAMNPELDITKEKEELDKEFVAYMEKRLSENKE